MLRWCWTGSLVLAATILLMMGCMRTPAAAQVRALPAGVVNGGNAYGCQASLDGNRSDLVVQANGMNFDTTGADLYILLTSGYGAATGPDDVADSVNAVVTTNTWTPIFVPDITVTGPRRMQFFYTRPPPTGPNAGGPNAGFHYFRTGAAPAICVIAISGSTTAALVKDSAVNPAVTSIQLAMPLATGAGNIIVSGVGTGSVAGMATNPGWVSTAAPGNAMSFAAAMSFHLPTAATENPTWIKTGGPEQMMLGAVSVTLNVPMTPIMEFVQQPQNVIANPLQPVPFPIPVQVRVTPGSPDQLQASINGGQSCFVDAGGTVTADSSGLATFSMLQVLGSPLPATCSLRIHNLSNSAVADIVSNSFTMTAPAPATLAFVGQPTDTVTGMTMAPFVIQATPSTFAGPITLVASNCPGTTFTGLGPITPVGGIAGFMMIVPTGIGTCVFTATATGATSVMSNPFNVTNVVPPTGFVQNVIGGGIIP